MTINVDGIQRKVIGSYRTMTVPDCFVVESNKIGKGHGERKFYVGSNVKMEQFFGWYKKEDCYADIFVLKSDLLRYIEDVESEYKTPTVKYRSNNLYQLWEERKKKIEAIEQEILGFTVKYQNQIEGIRGYINAEPSETYYDLLREISLPLLTYISVHKVEIDGATKIYWKLFYSHYMSNEIKNGPLVFKYGKLHVHQAVSGDIKDDKRIDVQQSRKGQGKYRKGVLSVCKKCPITQIKEERLLIASHIRPWRSSTDEQKIDKYNGFALSPLFDSLFDKGFITFTDNKEILFSQCIPDETWEIVRKCTGSSTPIANGDVIKDLPLGDKRKEYLKYHREHVYNGLL